MDTDEIAHSLVRRGQPLLEKIRDEFGKHFLLPNGELDRVRMRETIFADRAARARLEAILHPEILRIARREIASVRTPYCIVVIPLFTELGSFEEADRILVVDTQEAIQIERVMDRDKVSREHAKAILDSQASRHERLGIAHDVITNIGPPADLRRQVNVLHEQYLAMASEKMHKAT